MQSSPTTKFRKLAPSESLAMLVDPPTSDEEACGIQGEPIAVRVAVQRLRLVLVTTVMVVVIVALTLILNQGVVVEHFDRRDVSIKQQEALLEKYNSYSGSIAGALERPVELVLGFAVQIVVLRMLADDVLRAQNRWRVTAAGVAIGATVTYLLTNGLSAVNVQVREQTVQMVIQAEDLAIPEPNVTGTTTANASFSEDQHANPVANTIMRGLVLQPPTAKSPDSCPETNGVDRVEYRIPQRAWMKDFIPTALEAKSMRLEITKTKSALNDALTIDQFPMNASVAAELLVYSFYDRQNGSAWAYEYGTIGLTDFGFLNRTAIKSVDQNPATVWRKNFDSLETHVPMVRVSNLLPANPASTEKEDRAWFLRHAAASMYNASNSEYKNASQLKSWNMTFAHVDIEPNVLWMDAVTIEREIVSPRLQTEYNRSYVINSDKFKDFKFIPKAENAPDDRIDMYMACADAAGLDALVAVVTKNSTYVSAKCLNRSSHSLVVISVKLGSLPSVSE